MFFVGVAVAFFVLHSLLYVFHRREPGNLYLAFVALGYAIFSAEDSVDRRGLDAGTIHWLQTLGVAGISIMIVAFIRFGHHFVRRSAPRVYRFFVAAGILAVLVHAVTGSLLVPQLVALLSLGELVRMLIYGVRHPPGRHSWVVAVGFLAILLTAGVDTLSGLGVLPPRMTGNYAWGMLALFTSMSTYLSWTFADTNRDLQARVVEVDELTREAVERERRAQRRARERELLERDHERQRRELEAARELQLSMLPVRAPSRAQVEVEFEMRTASEVGGDFYDYVEDVAGGLTLALGDATGHGLDAGLMVVATKGLLHAATGPDDLLQVLERIERGLDGLGLKRRHMALVLLRALGDDLQAISAGMPPLLIYRRASGRVEEVAAGAPPLAAIPDHVYAPVSIRLDPGDTLLAYSDGLPERLDPDDESFGYSRLEECLARVGDEPLADVRRGVFAAAEAWA
ncbi:MAG: SpoIIE family protein phosphatase, partial [Thermoanaerobaculia bacterium]|nr:SpoIIE family protein phosphatase [Thermoanaerobaculia bacterium]